MFHVVSIIHVENPVWETGKPLSLKMGASFQSLKTSGRWWGNHLNRWSAGRCWELIPGNERLENRGLFESLEATDFYTPKKSVVVCVTADFHVNDKDLFQVGEMKRTCRLPPPTCVFFRYSNNDCPTWLNIPCWDERQESTIANEESPGKKVVRKMISLQIRTDIEKLGLCYSLRKPSCFTLALGHNVQEALPPSMRK